MTTGRSQRSGTATSAAPDAVGRRWRPGRIAPTLRTSPCCGASGAIGPGRSARAVYVVEIEERARDADARRRHGLNRDGVRCSRDFLNAVVDHQIVYARCDFADQHVGRVRVLEHESERRGLIDGSAQHRPESRSAHFELRGKSASTGETTLFHADRDAGHGGDRRSRRPEQQERAVRQRNQHQHEGADGGVDHVDTAEQPAAIVDRPHESAPRRPCASSCSDAQKPTALSQTRYGVTRPRRRRRVPTLPFVSARTAAVGRT